MRSADSCRQRAAASSRASGMPSRRWQIWAMAGALASLTAKEGRARCARSTNRTTASYCDSAGTSRPPSGLGQRIDGTRQVISPGTPSGSRLVVSTEVDGFANSRAVTSSAQAATRCSQLSKTRSDGLVAELDRQLVNDGTARNLAGAQRGQRGPTDGVRIGQRGQLDPPHAARLRVECLRGHGEGEAGLADAGRTGQRHQPLPRQHFAHLDDLAPPTDERCELDREVVVEHVERAQRRKRRRQIGVDQLPDVLRGSEVLEAVQPEISQRRPHRETIGHQRRGRRRTPAPDRRVPWRGSAPPD